MLDAALRIPAEWRELDEKNLCLGLGILRGIDVKDLSVRVITPLRDISRIRHISMGSIRVSPAGKELGMI